MGLFGSKKPAPQNRDAPGANEKPAAAGSQSHPAARNSAGPGNGAASARSDATAKMQNRGNGSDPSADQRSEGSRNRAGLERGNPPPTGGTSVATIGKSIIIKGDLSGDEDLIIEGKVEGRVQLPNNEITVGADGRITADIEAKAIIVIGQIAGNLTASQRVEVQSTATVEGDITAPKLLVEEGAVVNGGISMTKSPVTAEAQPPKPQSLEEQARKSA